MIALGNFIDGELRKLHNRVYHEEAQQGAELPYVVYNFPNSTEYYDRIDFILEVDIWGTASYTLDIEELTGIIDSHLHRMHYVDGTLQVSMYRLNRLAIPDPDISIRRRQLRYQVHTYL